jgi:hypothetical protein
MQGFLTSNGPALIGYHGCDRVTGERVLSGEIELMASTNDYDWLGHGIYFWENDPIRALNWARTVLKHGKRSRTQVAEPFVIGAVIQMGNCLDLMQAQSIRLVRDAHSEMKAVYAELEKPLPVNRMIQGELALRRLDCAVVQFLHRDRDESQLSAFDTVRAAFPEGAPLYETAGFLERTHIQICVRHPGSVQGYFRVKTPR